MTTEKRDLLTLGEFLERYVEGYLFADLQSMAAVKVWIMIVSPSRVLAASPAPAVHWVVLHWPLDELNLRLLTYSESYPVNLVGRVPAPTRFVHPTGTAEPSPWNV